MTPIILIDKQPALAHRCRSQIEVIAPSLAAARKRSMARVDKDKLNLAEVSAIGIGGMIGGGIFAVLGLAIATAGHAVVLTLAGGGLIALLTGLSYAHLGLHFRGDGGSFTYIEKAFASPLVAGCAGWLLVVGYVGTLAACRTGVYFNQADGLRRPAAVMAPLEERRLLLSMCGFEGLGGPDQA